MAREAVIHPPGTRRTSLQRACARAACVPRARWYDGNLWTPSFVDRRETAYQRGAARRSLASEPPSASRSWRARSPAGVVLPPIQWRGAALEYGASPESVVCAGTHEYLERYIEQLAGELALELPERVRYYWIDAADVDRRCGEGHTGCASGFESVGNEPINHHELVHNVLHALDDHDAHWFFEEGLAELMDPTYFLRNRTHQVNDPRDWITRQPRIRHRGRVRRVSRAPPRTRPVRAAARQRRPR